MAFRFDHLNQHQEAAKAHHTPHGRTTLSLHSVLKRRIKASLAAVLYAIVTTTMTDRGNANGLAELECQLWAATDQLWDAVKQQGRL